jgi:hypothetical protein
MRFGKTNTLDQLHGLITADVSFSLHYTVVDPQSGQKESALVLTRSG